MLGSKNQIAMETRNVFLNTVVSFAVPSDFFSFFEDDEDVSTNAYFVAVCSRILSTTANFVSSSRQYCFINVTCVNLKFVLANELVASSKASSISCSI